MPTGEPQITQIGLSVVSATSTRSCARRSLIGWEGAGDRADQQPDVGVGDERVEDLAAPLVADGVPAVVDRVRHPEERRDPLVQLRLRGSRTTSAWARRRPPSRSAMWAPVPPLIA